MKYKKKTYPKAQDTSNDMSWARFCPLYALIAHIISSPPIVRPHRPWFVDIACCPDSSTAALALLSR